MRFRKSIKICKGVKLNLSGSGMSLTTGVKGMSVTTGTHGTYLNTSIPGTGIYSRQKLGGSSKPSRSQQAYNKQAEKAAQRDHVAQEVSRYNDHIDELINIITKSEMVYTADAIHNSLTALTQEVYQMRPFEISMPTKEDVKKLMEFDAKQNVSKIAFWSLRARREQYVKDRLEAEYSKAYTAWAKEKERFDDNERRIAEAENRKFQERYNLQRTQLLNILSGDPSYVDNCLSSWLSKIELPLDFSVQYEYNSATHTLIIDLDLPEIEDLPSEYATQLASGKLKMKNKTQAALRQDYATCVFGLAVYLCSHFFNISTAIERIIMSGYTQRRDKEGSLNDDYIYSVVFNRFSFEGRDLTAEDPISFCMSFENRCLLTKTNLFKVIRPFAEDHI